MHSSPDILCPHASPVFVSHLPATMDGDFGCLPPKTGAAIVRAGIDVLASIDGLAMVDGSGLGEMVRRILSPEADRLRRALHRAGALPPGAVR